MTYSISNIASILGLPQPPHPGALIDCLLTDSRSLVYPDRTLFFALHTATNDGHRYIEDLYARGVRNFVVERIPGNKHFAGANMLVVDNVLEALQSLATSHRCRFDAPVIGITGSRGKTTVKEWLTQLLAPDCRVVRSPRSFNSQTGVPLSLWEMDCDTELGIFEAGISQPGEMESLHTMIQPNIGIFTALADDHSSGFISDEQKCREKCRLLRGADTVIFNCDNPVVAECIDADPLITGEHITVSASDPSATLYVKSTETASDGSEATLIRYSWRGEDAEVRVELAEPAQIDSALLCLAVLRLRGVDAAESARRMAGLRPVGTRLDVVEGVNDCLIIHDSYTSDLPSLAPAIDFMERRCGDGRGRCVIFSDVMHETMASPSLYRKVASLLRCKGIERVIGIGREISQYGGYFGVNASFYPSTDAFLAEVSTSDFAHELVLVKGAPQFGFGRIVETLEARRYETVLDVNLDALVHNYNHFRSRLRPSTGIVCMLKASGYGAGSYELAKTLQQQGAAYLGVAVTDEGVDLRHAGITMPIMVLNPRVVNYRDLFTYSLEPEIYSYEIMDEIIREAEKYGISDYPVHIKLDTGMHRLGFTEADIPELHSRLLAQRAIRPATIFSHLATADCLDMDDYTLQQLNTFERCCDRLQQGFAHHIKRHILNTAGIIRFPQYQGDLVRLGIGLYGVPTLPAECDEGELRPVSSLHTVIVSLHERQPGQTVGYSRRGHIERPSLIATCPIGYADGLNRHLGNGRLKVTVGGIQCPTVGNICMDVCMIDVTDVPGVRVGDRVEIFGSHTPVGDVAELLDTIPYEVLTSVATRVKRVYYRE